MPTSSKLDELFFFGLVFTFRGIAKLFGNKKPGGESVFHSFLGSKSLGIENKVQGILKKRDTHTHIQTVRSGQIFCCYYTVN